MIFYFTIGGFSLINSIFEVVEAINIIHIVRLKLETRVINQIMELSVYSLY